MHEWYNTYINCVYSIEPQQCSEQNKKKEKKKEY